MKEITKDELIAQQQLEIENLKLYKKEALEEFQHIYGMAYSVGAPLNDNCLDFNQDQRAYLRRLVSGAEGFLDQEEYEN